MHSSRAFVRRVFVWLLALAGSATASAQTVSLLGGRVRLAGEASGPLASTTPAQLARGAQGQAGWHIGFNLTRKFY